jgi:hypothetical protein
MGEEGKKKLENVVETISQSDVDMCGSRRRGASIFLAAGTALV